MSYGDYLNKLHFGSVSDGIQAMKDHEIAGQTNSLELKSLGLDSDIDKLTGKLADVQDATDPATTIESAVSGAGGAIESMATMKKLYSKFKDMKGKLKGKAEELKGKAQDKMDELKGKAQDKMDEANDKLSGSKDGGETKSAEPDGENPDEFAYSSDNPGVPQANKAQRGETEDFNDEQQQVLDDFENGLPQEEMDAMDAAPSEFSQVTSRGLPQSRVNVQDSDSGATMPSSEPYGSGEGSIEMQTFSSNVPDDVPSGFTGTGDYNPEIAENDPATAGRELETDMDNLSNEATSVNKTLTSDTTKLDNAIKQNAEADGEGGNGGDDDAEIDAGDVEDEVAAGAEEAGFELDATGVGAAIGIFLNVGGLVLGAISGSEDASTKTTDETAIQNSITADQNKINQIKQQELNIKSQIAQQHFTGANIVPNISSTTLDNVTSSSF